ncbi:ASCH domain-containing protein [bacterium]|nr:MAG: ASCH domain-containing protein [bacterium]
MKAISLWQPWASLIAIGAKRVETRGWSTSYRGPLAIHAAKNTSQLDYCTLPSFLNALHGAGMWQIPDTITSTFSERSIVAAYHKLTIKQKLQWLPLPLGAVVAIVDLVDCVPTETLAPKLSLDETAFGNYTRGRFGWVLENVRKIEPVPYRGAQGFFTVERAVLGGDFA